MLNLDWHIGNINNSINAGLVYRAEKHINLVLAANSQDPRVIIEMAFKYLDLKQYSCALQLAESAKQILVTQGLSDESDDILNLLIAKSYLGLGEIDVASSYCDCIDLETASSNIRWGLADFNLLLGNFNIGWKLYEERFNTQSNRVLHAYPFSLPRWNGVFKWQGNILIHGEQGLGDEIMFSSYIKDLLSKAVISKSTIYLAASTATFELFKRSFPNIVHLQHRRGPEDVDAWIQGYEPPWLNSLPKNIEQVPICSLPLLLSVPIPVGEGHLIPASTDINYFKNILTSFCPQDNLGPLKIGLAWCANLRTPYGEEKSIPVEMFANLSRMKDFKFISIQGSEYGWQINDIPNSQIKDLGKHLTSLDKIAALIKNLDLVVSIDTAYCHLAGSLGIPCITLLKRDHDWRFGLGDNCPFYRNMKLIRQSIDGDWSGPIEELQYLLQNYSRKSV